MDRHVVPRSHRQQAFGRTARPALEINSGDVVTFETTDEAYERLWRGESPDEIPDDDYNIVTGPVVVRNAEPGDAMRIEIVDIHIRRVWSVWIPGYGPLGDLADELQVRPLPFADGQIAISDRLKVPLSPMIGCIGLAPAAGTASTLEPAYTFGGNLDLCELCVGATLLLPVQTSGAWLSIGDLHAAMGAGEPAHISLEASGEATVRVTVEKNLRLFAPRILLEDRTLCLSVLDEDETIERA
ncbi:MAG: acetamidase/formamidase family protein, partial [Schlesneria sp.]